jgi:hypothetical protein
MATARRRSSGGPGGGCARMPVGTHPHLLVVGVGNPIAVPSLARLGARRVKSGGCDPRISSCREASIRRAFKNIRCIQASKTQDFPLCLSDTYFQGLILLAYSLVYGLYMYLKVRFAATRVRTNLSWRWALELAADSREAPHGQGAR